MFWNLPCSLKGELKHFEVKAAGWKRTNRPDHFINTSLQVDTGFEKNDIFNISLEELRPQYSYAIEISAIIGESDTKGASYVFNLEYPAGSEYSNIYVYTVVDIYVESVRYLRNYPTVPSQIKRMKRFRLYF